MYFRQTWRRCWLSCLIIALKYNDDLAIWNEDFVKRFEKLGIGLSCVQVLEQETLKKLNYELHITSTEYSNAVSFLSYK